MLWRWLKAVFLLPGMVLGVIPLLLLGGASMQGAAFWRVICCGLVALPGILLAGWTMYLFYAHGQGTPAPWDPPTRLVVYGPYRHTRNPMILSVFILLLAEAIYFGTTALWVWWWVFVVGNILYIPLKEEPALIQRFGPSYRAYTRAVPRWGWRFKGYRQTQEPPS